MTTRVDPRHGTVTIDLPAPVDVVAAVIHGITAAFPDAVVLEGPPDVLIIALTPPGDRPLTYRPLEEEPPT